MKNVDFPSGFARVRARGDDYFGQVGKVIGEDASASGHWITLEIDDEEIIFERGELAPCPAPAG